MSLLKVCYQGTKKYVRLETLSFSCLICTVREKFKIDEYTPLQVTDEDGVEVDEDVFPDLAIREIGFLISAKELPLLEPVNLTNCANLEDYGPDLSRCVTLDLEVLEDGNDPRMYSCLADASSVSSSLSSETSLYNPGQNTALASQSKTGCSASNNEVASSDIQQNMAPSRAKLNVAKILKCNPAGRNAIKEYDETGTLKESTRRIVVNVIVAAMCDTATGRIIHRQTKEFHAQGIVEMFPSLKDSLSKKGYEHFFDINSNTGFIQWRLKTVQRQTRKAPITDSKLMHHDDNKGGPTSPRMQPPSSEQQRDESLAAMSLLQHTTDGDLIFSKMRQTFSHRQQLLCDPQCSSDLLQLYPRFMDTKGLILQDFSLMFGEEVSSKFLEKWNMCYKGKIINEAQTLNKTSLLRKCLQAALNEPTSPLSDEQEWDSDMSSLILLLYLLSPQVAGKKRAKKISVEEATDHLVKFQKSFQSLEDHLQSIDGNPQPYLLAQGTSKNQVSSFYIVLDKKLIPCQSNTSLGAFDELFKCHFVFSLRYADCLYSMYTFLQTTVYNIDIGTTDETPRVRLLRARILNKQ